MQIWQPHDPTATRMYAFLKMVEKNYQCSLPDYQALHAWSIQYPEAFWKTLCDYFNFTFSKPPKTILNTWHHPLEARWFIGAQFNFSEKLLQRRDAHPALVSIDETGQQRVISYVTLYQQTMACAATLKALGIGRGDRVAGFMPNIPETIIAALACNAIGAIWSACSPDFGAQAVIDRLGQIEPKVLFTVDGYLYQGKTFSITDKVDHIITGIPTLHTCVIYPFLSNLSTHAQDGIQCLSWHTALQTRPLEGFEQLPFDHPLYILFSSGTTGKPKCIMHGQGGTLLQHLKELALHGNLSHHDNLMFYTTCSWMMWHWMVSVLALGATLTLYEGAPNFPDPMRLFNILEQEHISAFGTSAKFIAMVEKSGFKPIQTTQLAPLKIIFSTGSPLLPQHFDFVYQHIKSDVQLASISGGTDIISCFALGNPMLPVYRGELQCIGLGMAVKVYNEHGQSVVGERGELVCTQPFPSMPIGFWQDPDKTAYQRAYFNRFLNIWTHGDFAEITPHGSLMIYGRSDTILNPGGVRIGTAEIYRQVETIPDILESVVIGESMDDDIRVVLFVKLKPGIKLDDVLRKKICQTLRQNASPRHVPDIILEVPDIPRTINNKIVELAVKYAVEGKPIDNMGSIANPQALEYFKNREELKRHE